MFLAGGAKDRTRQRRGGGARQHLLDTCLVLGPKLYAIRQFFSLGGMALRGLAFVLAHGDHPAAGPTCWLIRWRVPARHNSFLMAQGHITGGEFPCCLVIGGIADAAIGGDCQGLLHNAALVVPDLHDIVQFFAALGLLATTAIWARIVIRIVLLAEIGDRIRPHQGNRVGELHWKATSEDDLLLPDWQNLARGKMYRETVWSCIMRVMGSPENEFQSRGPQALSDAAWVK